MKKKEKLEVVHGSGNIFRDFGDPDADVKQLNAILAAEIIKKLDGSSLSVRDLVRFTAPGIRSPANKCSAAPLFPGMRSQGI